MEDLKLLLIDRLKSKGIDPALIPAFLKALTSLISSEPGIDPAVANQKMHSLGWTEVTVDYHCLQIVIACLESDAKMKQGDPTHTHSEPLIDPSTGYRNEYGDSRVLYFFNAGHKDPL
jgi:hypothetical protein